MIRISGIALILGGASGAENRTCTVDDFVTKEGRVTDLMSAFNDCRNDGASATAFRTCFTTAVATTKNECGSCFLSVVTNDDLTCGLSCLEGNGNCDSCAFPILETMNNQCFSANATSLFLPFANLVVGIPGQGAICDLSPRELAALPTDLIECSSQSEVPKATCFADRGYNPLETCGSCLAMSGLGRPCDCSDPAFDCVQCNIDRARQVWRICVPQREWSVQVPEKQCSMADVVAAVSGGTNVTSLIQCVRDAPGSATHCLPSSVSAGCSACLDSVIADVHSTCTDSCEAEIGGAVIARCLGDMPPPQPSPCSDDDGNLFPRAQADAMVIACNAAAPRDVRACLDVSSIGTLSDSCLTCLEKAHPWSSDLSCAAPCSLTSGNVTCATPPDFCALDSVDTGACYDPNGVLARPDDLLLEVCHVADLAGVASSFASVDISACTAITNSTSAYACVAALVDVTTPCMQCVSATVSIVSDCASDCKKGASTTACQACMVAGVTQAAGRCMTKGMPSFLANLIPKTSSVSPLTGASMLLGLVKLVLLLY